MKYTKNLSEMWCHDGRVSLAGFVSGIITTIFTSVLVLTFFSLELNTFWNVLLVFIGPFGTYAIFCGITYFVTNQHDFAVFLLAFFLFFSFFQVLFSF